jgi:hypothetical protein
MQQLVRILTITGALAGALLAQSRQATIVGGGSSDRGKCTLEVVVDDVAQVEIHGNVATLRTVSGQPAQWRRFECTAPMPPNPANFRFAGVDGRGRQQLVRDPRNGGVAVVQIEDKEGGAEGYTFDIEWDQRGYNTNNNPNFRNNPTYNPNVQERSRSYDEPRNRPGDGYGRGDEYRPDYRDSEYYRQYGHPFATDEAVRVCQQSVADQASRRFGTNNIHFHGTRIDDNPGRQDWVTGTMDVHRGAREERFHFSCSVNFNNGRVRSAEIDPRPLGDDSRWWH